MNNSKYSMVVIGQFTLDDVVCCDAPPKLDSPGGAGMYALGGACIWRQDHIGFVARRGNDYDIAPVLEQTGDRVDVSGLVELPVPGIHIWNMFDRKGNRYFIMQRWSSGDDLMGPRPEDIPAGYIDRSGNYLVTAFPLEYQAEMIRCLPGGATIMVDPHFMGIYSKFRDTWTALLKKIDIFVPSEEELLRFFDLEAQDEMQDYLPYLRKLAEYGPGIVCVKIGPRGVLAYERESDMAWHIPAYDAKVVDVTGCGDSFCGGFFSSYLRSHDVFEACLYGSVSSAFNIEHHGSLANFQVSHEAAQQRLQEFRSQQNKDKQRIL